MYPNAFKPIVFFAIFVLLVGMACSLTGTETPTETPAETQEPPVVETEAPQEPSPEPSPEEETGEINTISAAESAVIQIQAEGTFIDPEFGLILNAAGRGSGFIIDPSGLAVTNNHVVTGSALIKVRLAEDTSWRNARLVAVSECSDLAVIDIEGDGFPYFDWYAGDIDVGTELYVAGFPLGDPEYTLTKGVISKARADGESNWASVDHVIEYDANALPGNSGGPVLAAEDASVIGVHYAGNQSTRQAFGISRDVARRVIDRLKTGENVDTIGINGQAVGTEDGSLTGIWVSSVQSGSPADKAGVRAGDILYQLENLVLATDGTMADYCDILRTHNPDDTLSMSIIRWATGEILEGQLNGRDLAVTGVFGGGTDPGTDPGSDPGTDPGSGEVAGSTGVYNFNASASGDIAFGTEFDEGDLSDWFYFLTNGNENDFSLYLENGVLNWETTGRNNWAYLINDQIEMTDVRIDVSVENRGVNQNNVSLICRYEDGVGWYEFNIANDGTWTILRFDEVNNSYAALYTGGSLNINMGKDVNEYTAVCSGSELTLYINGVHTRTVNDRTLRTGLVGISASSFDQTPVLLEWDYVIFSIP
jgi:S1-C subfamily serine protease